MKNLLRVIVFFIICLLFIACGQQVTVTSLPTTTLAATFTPVPNLTATAIVEPTSRPEFVLPTLIPTIDPTMVPELLSNALSVQRIEGVNGHNIQQITGWDYGFGDWRDQCSGYDWLDEHHLLLYPAAGQVGGPQGVGAGIDIVPQPAVINLKSGSTWLPVNVTPATCNRVYWSPELGTLITSEVNDGISTVSTFTYDGFRLSSYPGRLLSVSPSRTKILISEDTLIDLRANKTVKLAWSLENYDEQVLSGLYWTYPEETRVYRCCYFYADLNTGTSHRFERSDFQDTNGNHLDSSGLWFHRGQWVRNDTYFLVQWNWIDDGDIRYLPMFDPAEKLFYDVREMAGIPEDWMCYQTTVSPDGTYVWMVGEGGSYLVTLFTFDAQYFPGRESLDIDWAPNSRFVWLQSSTNNTTQYDVLSAADKVIKPLPVTPTHESEHWWHPTDNTIVFPDQDGNSLMFLDVSTMSYRELPFTLQETSRDSSLAWNLNGKKLAFVAKNGSVWQVDYPTLENLERLTPSLPDVSDLNWSPDGNSIAFISGLDIYVVETTR